MVAKISTRLDARHLTTESLLIANIGGKRFTASGVFKRIDSLSLLGGYFAIVDIGDHSVLCKLNFDRLDYLEKLAKGARVIIEGFIDDPLVDLVVIDNCKLTERLEWKPPRL